MVRLVPSNAGQHAVRQMQRRDIPSFCDGGWSVSPVVTTSPFSIPVRTPEYRIFGIGMPFRGAVDVDHRMARLAFH
nr:hypothetical protein [Brucella intermedia]